MNMLPPRRKILFVYIHGFLGSDESFESFPEHLMECLSQLHHLPRDSMESIVFPRFDTKGSNQLKVRLLVDWLLLNATTVRAENVVLLAHSMGGLLASDAYQVLYGVGEMGRNARANAEALRRAREKARAENAVSSLSWFLKGVKAFGSGVGKIGGSLRGSLTSVNTSVEKLENKDKSVEPLNENIVPSEKSSDTTPVENDKPTETPDSPTPVEDEAAFNPDLDITEIRFLINIRGIITFDSPFFGLSSNVITSAGAGKVVNAVTTASEYAKATFTAVMSSQGSPASLLKFSMPPVNAIPGNAGTMPAGWSFPGGSKAADEATDKLERPGWMKVEGGQAEAEVERVFIHVPGKGDAAEIGEGPDTLSTPVTQNTEKASNVVADNNVTKTTTSQCELSSSEHIQPHNQSLVLVNPNPTSTTTTTPTTPQKPEWSWTQIALASAGAAAGLYVAAGVVPIAAQIIPTRALIRGAATQWALQQVEEVRSHAEFLYPLINTTSEMRARVKALLEEMEMEGRLYFHGFYLELPPFGVSSTPPSTSESTTSPPPPTLDTLPDDPTQLPDAPLPPASRNFCVLPPVEVEHVFETTSSPLADEIDAHMHMFNVTLNQEHYVRLVLKTAVQILNVMEKKSVKS
ncbi:hypothetical protein BC829DRAFT_422060 [Chytridium lagenaria]|nr:hypothetical protein BC829DRAFT_422060 [Chytridium lagenaria]